MVATTEKLVEVRRVLDRYLVEVVEEHGFCPWARSARTGSEIGFSVLWGTPTPAQWCDAARTLLARPEVRVAMVVAPEHTATPTEFRGVRELVARLIDSAGVADFHPDGVLDLATPPRLVPFTRRSPDPLLQFVPLSLLKAVRMTPAVTSLAEQAKLLGGILKDPEEDVGDRIAVANHARVSRDPAAVERVLDDIAADRRRSYLRAGITVGTTR